MENFTRHFVRIERGKWTCVRPGEFTASDGKRIHVAIGSTFTRGANFMGVDLAQYLMSGPDGLLIRQEELNIASV